MLNQDNRESISLNSEHSQGSIKKTLIIFWGKNKKYLILLVLIIGLSLGFYWNYNYKKQGTPEYSLKQLQIVFNEKDYEGTKEYIDIEEIARNSWPRFKYLLLDKYKGDVFAESEVSIVGTQYPEILKQGFYNSVRGKSSVDVSTSSLDMTYSSSTDKSGGFFNPLLSEYNPNFKISDDRAILFKDWNRDGKTYKLTYIFRKQPDRRWKITDIQGIEDGFMDSINKGQENKN